MLYLCNPSSPNIVAAIKAGHLGYIDTPAQGNKRPDGVTWCADNGAYSDRFEEGRWWAWLTQQADHAHTCLFAVAPDIVGDADATLKRSLPWLSRIRDLGYPVAYAAQNGATLHQLPWDQFDVLFIGGTTAWKLGPEARHLVHETKQRGIRVHMGRVNSERRWRYAHAIGCDTVDGTYLTFGPDTNLPKLLAWQRNNDQTALWT